MGLKVEDLEDMMCLKYQSLLAKMKDCMLVWHLAVNPVT
jgi:hypothetical protein